MATEQTNLNFRDRIAGLNYQSDVNSVDALVKQLCQPKERAEFFSFASSLIKRLRQADKATTADTYTTAVNSFAHFFGNKELPFEALDGLLTADYQSWLAASCMCRNTISFYMRNLRAIYNRAVDALDIEQRFPFKHVYTGIDKTAKRAVTQEVIRALRQLDLRDNPLMDYARDLFMFSFYTRGMSFVDMAYLKKSDLQHGVLTYCRQKTKQRISVKWLPCMQEVVDKYDTASSPYLLPIIRDADADTRKQYKSAAHLVNCKLKKLGQLLGLPIPLTTYVARHTWASLALSTDASISTISKAMGHDSEATTRIYLAQLDTSLVDATNAAVLALL